MGLTGLNAIALVLSAILSWHYLQGGSIPGCSTAGPCEQILNSKWSTIAGVVPVSGLALGVYLAMLVTGFFIGTDTETSTRRLAWGVLLLLAGLVIGGALWFTIVQLYIMGEFCPHCMATHLTGILLSTIIIWKALAGTEKTPVAHSPARGVAYNGTSQSISAINFRPLQAIGLVAGGLALVLTLVASQIMLAPKGTYGEGESQDSQPGVAYDTAPIIGRPNAPYVIKMLFDYQCPHCQKIHFMLNEAVRRYKGEVAFVLCPTPLNTKCNPYIPQDVDAFKNSCELANIGLAVWVARRELYSAFDNWMFSFDTGTAWHPRSLEAARAKAVELVGREKFESALSSPWIGQYLQTCIQLYGETSSTGRGGVPKLILGPRWVIPQPESTDELITLLQKSLALPKP